MHRLDAIAFLQDIHDTLAAQHDLSPNNPIVNTCLRHLVATLSRWQAVGFGADLPDDAALGALRGALPRLCGLAECEMEKWWCRRILADPCPGVQALSAFWYLDNYRQLCRAERGLLGGRSGGAACFLGSGALPLTALMLAESDRDLCVTCVDRDGEACQLAADLIGKLGLASRIAVIERDAADHRPAPEETVICASLLRAPGLYRRLADGGVRRLIIRDAEGVYRFCYRPAAKPGVFFREAARTPPSPLRINTSRYYRRTAARSGSGGVYQAVASSMRRAT